MKAVFKSVLLPVFASVLSLASLECKALPLLSEAAGKVQYGTLTVYPDHLDAKKFYYFPNSTEFSRDQSGIPLFNFVYWGLTNPSTATEAGAYMSLTTRLESDTKQKDAIQKFLQDNPTGTLAVLPVMKSTIGLTSTTSQSPLGALFKEFNFSKVGGRAEDEIGINAVLNPVGAKAFKALLLAPAGGSPIKFDYCYSIQGLGPNMDAEIHVDMDRVYDAFVASHSGGYLWASWSIQTVVENLRQKGVITLKQNGGDAKDWEYMVKVSEEITKRLFTPELSASMSIGESKSMMPFRLNAGYVRKSEQKEEIWTWVRRDLVEREFCTAINVKDLGEYKKKLIVDADQN